MGCGPFSGRRISQSNSYVDNPQNPNPLLYEIEEGGRIGNLVILKVKYIGCTNFEGNKILILQDISDDEIRSLVELDPHFSVDSKLIARFRPDDMGWENAVTFAQGVWYRDNK